MSDNEDDKEGRYTLCFYRTFDTTILINYVQVHS